MVLNFCPCLLVACLANYWQIVKGDGFSQCEFLACESRHVNQPTTSRAVGRGVGAMGASAPLAHRKGLLNLRGRIKMTLRMQEKWTSTT